jgi:uncharacterized RDD family membrane protein YckC
MVILILLSWVFSSFDKVGNGIYLIFYFLLEWFYCVFFEMFKNGMTPGKKAFNIQVVHDDGTPLGWGASILRNIIRAVDFFPFAYLFGIISMTTSAGFKRLGDHAGATLVVYRPLLPRRPQIDQNGTRPAPYLFELDEQQAILAFAERSKQLSPSRQQELANILEPILPLPTTQPATQAESQAESQQARVVEIKKIANGIIGQA